MTARNEIQSDSSGRRRMTIEVAELREVLGEILPSLPADAESDLGDEGVMDSYAVVEVVALLEERYRIAFAPETLRKENFASLNAIASTVTGIRQSS